jgi:hypothetical protein
MKNFTVLFSVFILALFFSFNSTAFISAKTAKPLKADIKSSTLKSEKIQNSKTISSIKAKLPELVITKLALDSRCNITGSIQNKGGKILQGSKDFRNLSIKLVYTFNGKKEQVTLRTQKGSKASQPSLLSGTNDMRNFINGKPAKFHSNLKVPATNKGFAIVKAEIDPDNKIKETSSGERKKSLQARLKSRCPERGKNAIKAKTSAGPAKPTFKKQTMKIDPKTKQNIKIPTSSKLSNVTTRSNEPPYIAIEDVMLSAMADHILIRLSNTGGPLPLEQYPVLGLHLLIQGVSSSLWSFSQVDPDQTLFSSNRYFNTLKGVEVGTTINIRFSAIHGDSYTGVYEGLGRFRELTSFAETNTPSHVTTTASVLGEIESVQSFNQDADTPLRVNKLVIIRGDNFGTLPGTVHVSTLEEPNIKNYLTVQSWSENAIAVIINDSFRDKVGVDAGYGLNGRPFNLRVLPNGQTIGPTKRIDIYPDLQWYKPVVTESPALIAPGQTYDIHGDNFHIRNGSQSLKVEFDNPRSNRWEACSVSHTTNILRFVVPENSYVPDARVGVKITNTVGVEKIIYTTFLPQEYKTITERHGKHFDLSSIFCQYDACCKVAAIYRERTTNAFKGKRLINGWRVVNDPSVEVTYCKCAEINGIDLPSDLCRAWIIKAPDIRSNNPETRVKVKFKPEDIWYSVHVQIVGPQGLPHFANQEE